MRPEERLRSVPWEALDRLDVEPAVAEVLRGFSAEGVLDRFLREHRTISADERAAAAEAVFGVGLWRRRLAWAAGFPSWKDAPVPTLLDQLRRLPDGPIPERLAIRASLPDWLEAILLQELGDDASAFADAINLPGPVCVRVNTLRASRDELPGTPTSLSPLGVILPGRPNIYGMDAFRRGLFEVQDEGSQLVGLSLAAQPGESVLDFCAGAGGKTLLLAAEMRNTGTLWVYDIDGSRLSRLEDRAARAGVTNLRFGLPPAPVDRVLVDAPCTLLGTLRRGPSLRWQINPATFLAFEHIQAAILDQAATFVRPGGLLVYATCTIRRQENEAAVEGFLARRRDFAPDSPSVRWLPHLHGTDGFFAAALVRVPNIRLISSGRVIGSNGF
jgi:16S rRNA (cytosine967-C5)-methyltransferase